jgi:hypothetical protein
VMSLRFAKGVLFQRAGPLRRPPFRPSPCLRVSVLRPHRAAVGVLLAVAGLAALLQWSWAGWSVYTGPGPSAAMRWLLTGAVGAALLLPVAAGMAGAAAGRWLAESGLRDQARVTRRGVRQLMLLAAGRALGAPLLAVLGSTAGWLLVVLTGVGRRDLPGVEAIVTAHALVAVIASAFGLWGLALATRGWHPVARSGVWAPPLLALLVSGPALVGPLLPHLARPERLLNGTLVANPVTTVGATLGMDVLRGPRIYDLTRAPEYWYTYPSWVVVSGVYLVIALLGVWRLRQVLDWE